MSRDELPDYHELHQIIELAEDIETRLDAYWRRLVQVTLGFVVSFMLFVYFVTLRAAGSNNDAGIFAPLTSSVYPAVLVAMVIIIAATVGLPRAARKYVYEARAYAEASNLVREVYSIISSDSLSAVQRAEVDVRLSRLRLPVKPESSIFLILFPSLRRELRRDKKIVQSRLGGDYAEAKLERILSAKLHEAIEGDLESEILMEPTVRGVTVDFMMVREGSAPDLAIDFMYFAEPRNVDLRLVRSQERLRAFLDSWGDRRSGSAGQLVGVSLCVVDDDSIHEDEILHKIRRFIDRVIDESASTRSRIDVMMIPESIFKDIEAVRLIDYLTK